MIAITVTPQAGATEVMDAVAGRDPRLVLVDVRGGDEVGVSALPGALHLPAHPDDAAPHGWCAPGAPLLLFCAALR